MIEQPAVVVRTEGRRAWISVAAEGRGCGRCSEAGGCRSGLLARLFRPDPRHHLVENEIGAAAGDAVLVGVAEGAILRAALAIYAFPVLGLVAGAFVGTALAETDRMADMAAAMGAVLGLAGGWLAGVGLRGRWAQGSMRPTLVRKDIGQCIVKEPSK